MDKNNLFSLFDDRSEQSTTDSDAREINNVLEALLAKNRRRKLQQQDVRKQHNDQVKKSYKLIKGE